MYVAQMAFFNRISDPKLGGTYMTLLNTVANLGTDWPHTLVLYTVDYIGINMCTAKGGFMCLTVSQKEVIGFDIRKFLIKYYLVLTLV